MFATALRRSAALAAPVAVAYSLYSQNEERDHYCTKETPPASMPMPSPVAQLCSLKPSIALCDAVDPNKFGKPETGTCRQTVPCSVS